MPTHDKAQFGETLGEDCGPLLPGIPNAVTMDQIVPKLRWTAFHILSSVSRSWQKVIQSRLVYDTRVRFDTTETFAVLDYWNYHHVRRIAVYSTKDDSCYHLPPIPQVNFGIQSDLRTPTWSECICLDGRVYALRVLLDSACEDDRVYVFDMAGDRRWKKCASMPDSREGFGCGVLGGKIYVFEGNIRTRTSNTVGFEPVCGSIVYDPNEDVWSPIMPMKTCRINHQVTTVRDELFVYSGQAYDVDVSDSDDEPEGRLSELESAEIYRPEENEWRIVKDFSCRSEVVLTVGGKLHKLNYDGIFVYNMDVDSWSFVQSFSFNSLAPNDIYVVVRYAVAVGDELFGVATWDLDDGYYLVRTKLSHRNNEEWLPIHYSLPIDEFGMSSMCLIQL